MIGDDNTITLKDGRTLGYSEHGDPQGKPVIFVHGNPGSRLMRHPDESIAAEVGARIITPDRPGYGLSDFQKGRTLLDYPGDIAQLADALGIDRFAVFGVSAGGPYVLATAHRLPERVTRAAVASGAAPFDRDNPYEGVNETYQKAYKAAKLPGWLLTPLMRMQVNREMKDRDAYWQEVLGRASAADRDVLEQPAMKAQVLNYRPEAVRQGVAGTVQEAKILVSPWGFPLEAVEPEVHLWYWEDDSIVPPQMGRYLEARLPNSVPHFLPGGGHFAFIPHWRDILAVLVA